MNSLKFSLFYAHHTVDNFHNCEHIDKINYYSNYDNKMNKTNKNKNNTTKIYSYEVSIL